MKNQKIAPVIVNPFMAKEYHVYARQHITPDVAQVILNSVPYDGPAKDDTLMVATISAALRSGTFDTNTGNTVKFEAVTGHLIDGAARLKAVVNTGIALITSVAVGCSSKTPAFVK